MKPRIKTEKIQLTAVDLLNKKPDALRYTQLVNEIKKSMPNELENTIQTAVSALVKDKPDQVYKPDRGLFRLVKFKENSATSQKQTKRESSSKIYEEDFYQPFADFLKNDLEECAYAIPLGGRKFKDKWGTPDVLGINQPNLYDPIKFEHETISAEIKIDTTGLIEAFGQACAYTLFSHKVYLVIPRDSPKEEVSRIESLCSRCGVGLILFDRTNKESTFEIRVRARKEAPDNYYTNECIKRLGEASLRELHLL